MYTTSLLIKSSDMEQYSVCLADSMRGIKYVPQIHYRLRWIREKRGQKIDVKWRRIYKAHCY